MNAYKSSVLKSKTKWKGTPRAAFRVYKHSAKAKGLEFALDLSFFESNFKAPCHYCGEGIETIGLDRVENGVGYTEANIVPCCSQCNYAKKNYTQESFISMCKRVAAIHA